MPGDEDGRTRSISLIGGPGPITARDADALQRDRGHLEREGVLPWERELLLSQLGKLTARSRGTSTPGGRTLNLREERC